MLKSEAAAYLAGVTQTEGAEASAPTNLHVITGEVGEASADGKTLVKIDGLMFSESDDQFIEVDALGGLEEGDIATIVLTGEQGHAMTPLAIGSIGSVDRITVRIAAIEADYIKVEQLDAAEARIGELEADHVSVDDLDAATARIGTLETTRATITDLEAAAARIGDLEADHVSTDDLDAATARIGTLETNTADIGTIRANSAKVQKLTAAELEADHAAIEALDSNYAHITNGVIDNATIGYADVNNLSAHYAEIQNGKINSALIDTAAIVDEQVFTVTGNKATISQLNADHINVRSINVKDLTVETANGYVNVGGKQTPTKELLDSIKDELQQEIDGAVETFTSSAVPLLNNYPASDWIISGATEEEQRKAYAKHVGDICYVQNSDLDQNGYAYRFAYDSTEQTFKWVLIKDSDVTKALGDISDLKTFESNTTTWMEETDEGLTTIRQNHTALSGVVDKTVVETKQLWYTKANTTAPSKPTAQVTSTSTAGNAWRVVVPAYNASYPNYYYCLQYKLADGTYAWSDVVRDIAMGESQQQGRKGVADAATAQSTADSATTAAATADGKAVAAQSTANANIKSSVQLWFTKANTTAPNKPTAQVTVNDATKTNQWNLAIPTYSASYPNYFYCYQQQKGDGTWQWTDVVYDRSITEAQAKAQASLPSSEFNTFKTTTFKELVDEVDEQSSTISTLSETVSTKADSSTVTTLSNTVNTVKQTADTNKTSITNLTQTVNNKADSTTVTTLTNRVSTVEQNLSGITTRVSKTESELDTVSNPNLTPYFSRDKGDVYNASTNPSGYWKNISTDYITALDDGWVHISASNSGTSNLFVNYFTAKTSVPKDLVASTKYTFLVETRGVTKSGNVVVYASHHFGSELHAFTSSAGYSVSGEESKYFTVTSASDLSSIACFTRGYVQVPSNGSVDMDIRISLYEGEYSGPYKPYVDQTLSNRVKSAETTIEQNANDISLRATKTEAYQSAQPNLSPFFSITKDDVYNASTNPTGYWKRIATNTQFTTYEMQVEHNGSEGWAHFAGNATSGNPFVRFEPVYKALKPSTTYTFLAEVEGTFNNSSNVNLAFYSGTNQSDAIDPFSTSLTINVKDGGAFYRTGKTRADVSASAVLNRGYLQIYGTGTFDCYIRLSLYEGEYTGPYKPYSGAQLYASQAELKVANDNINLKVSKNDVINQINVSTEGAKIQASKVEIDGTAVFNAAKSKLDAAYDAKGAASAVEQGLGGFDILWNRVSYDSDENAGGECYICAYDPITAIRSNANGWVMWNGAKRTIPRGGINPNNIVPYNIPVYLVCRLSSATSDTGTMYMVWYNSGWKYAVTPTPTAVGGTWTWTETTDMVIGKFVEPGSEVAFTECETYRQPLKWGSITTDTVTARSANAAAASAQSTANAAAPKANAVKRTQRIWYRKSTSGAPATPGTASSNWVTKDDDGNDAWTKMHIAISSTHKYIYTCEQYEMANGTVGYTSVLLDNTITVIDGGNIITGSVTANKLNAANINASKTLTVGAMTDAAASTILNSNMVVGGRNLLRDTDILRTDGSHWHFAGGNTIAVTTNNSDPDGGNNATLVTVSVAADHYIAYRVQPIAELGWYTFSIWMKASAGHNLRLTLENNGEYRKTCALTTSWQRFDMSFNITTLSTTNYLIIGGYSSWTEATPNIYFYHPKLEKGNKATDWTPAPEDQVAYVDKSINDIDIGGRNLLRRSYYQQTTTTNGITCTNNGDGSVTINGTTTATPTIYYFNDSSESSRGHVTLDAGTYTLSGCPDGGGDDTWRLDIYGIPISSGTGVAVDYGDGATFTTTGGAPTLIRLRFPSGITLNNFTVWPKLERGNKATDWTPAPEDITAEKYITSIDDNGIRVHAESNTTTNYAAIDADGMDVVKGGVSVAQFGKDNGNGPSARIGKEASTHVTISASETSGTGYTDSTSDMTLYDATGNSPDLRLYNTSRAWSDDSDGSEEVGIALGRDVYASKIKASIYEGEDPSSNLEILTGDLSTSVNAGTFIGSQRHWASDSSKFDKASVQTTSGAGGGASVRISAMSGNPNAAGAYAGMSVKATSSSTTVTIEADEVRLYDHQQDSYSPAYVTHGVVNSGQSISTPANGYKDFTVTFGHTYTSYPHVVPGFYSTSTAAGLGGLSCAVNSITYTGCTIRVFNNTSTARSPAVEWIAIG